MDMIPERIRKLLTARREELSYLVVGGLTTVLNYAVFWLLKALWQGRYVLLANGIAFVAAVAFAYVANKIWVFQSYAWSVPVLKRELIPFIGARLFSFAFEEAGLLVADRVLRLGRWHIPGAESLDGILLAKLLLNVFVVVMNYFFSKFLIFRQKTE